MAKTIIVYGSSTGTCESIANTLASKLQAEAINAADLTAGQLQQADNILLGTSTWGVGEVQDDWYDGMKTLRATDLSGKRIALFGCGDCADYSDSFCGGMKELYDAALATGATLIGQTSTEGYTFDDSEAVVDGKFVGLALDDINESAQTEPRIDAWLAMLQL